MLGQCLHYWPSIKRGHVLMGAFSRGSSNSSPGAGRASENHTFLRLNL